MHKLFEVLEPRRMLSRALALVVNGTDGDDVIVVQQASASAFAVTVNGVTTSHDVSAFNSLLIDGMDGDDVLTNQSALRSSILGGAGDDTLTSEASGSYYDPGGGSDVLYTGESDIVEYASLQAGVFGIGVPFASQGVLVSKSDGGADLIQYTGSGIAIRLTSGDDHVQGELGFGVTLLGGEGDDQMFMWQRPDDVGPFRACRVDGEAGNDTLRSGWYEDIFAADSVWGGGGDDVIYGNGARMPGGLDGGAGFDVQTEVINLGLPDPDRNYGFRVGRNVEVLSLHMTSSNGLFVLGNDQGSLIDVSANRVTVVGGGGDDTIFVGRPDGSLQSDDLVLGGGGNDLTDAGAGNDSIDGGLGSDTLRGGPGLDHLLGGDGNDWLIADEDGEPDTLDGGGGFDRVLTLSSNGNDVLRNVERTLPARLSRLAVDVLFPDLSRRYRAR